MSLMIKHYTIDGKNCTNNNSLVPICNNDNTSTDKETNELKDPGDFRFPDNYPKYLQSRFTSNLLKDACLPVHQKSNSNPNYNYNTTEINTPHVKIIPFINPKKPHVNSYSSRQPSLSCNPPMEIHNEPINNSIFIKCNGRDEEMEIPCYTDLEEKTVVDNQSLMQLSIVIPEKKEEYIVNVNNIPIGIAGSQTIIFHVAVDDDFVEINGNVEGCDNIVEAIKKDII